MKTEISAAKHLGQHFLVDENIIADLLYAIKALPGENILEIGPGLGALTLPLLQQCKKMTAIDLDKRIIEILAKKAEKIGELKLIYGDFLQFELQDKSRIVGNLPYNLSSPILLYCLENHEKIIDMHFMLQKEVVERICATENQKSYGRLSLAIQRYFIPVYLFDVPASAFSPPPRVESAVVRLQKRENSLWQIDNEALFDAVIRSAFQQRRKMLRQSLKSLISSAELENLEINPQARAENLSGFDFAKIANYLNGKALP